MSHKSAAFTAVPSASVMVTVASVTLTLDSGSVKASVTDF